MNALRALYIDKIENIEKDY